MYYYCSYYGYLVSGCVVLIHVNMYMYICIHVCEGQRLMSILIDNFIGYNNFD